MYHLSSGESSKLQFLQKPRLLGELEDANRSLASKEEEMRKLVKRKQRLEEAQERQVRERRWETRNYMHHGRQKEEQDWRVHNFEERCHQHQPPKDFFSFCKVT